MRLCLAFAFGIAAAFGTELPPASAVVGNEFPPHHCEKWESSRVDPREPNTHIKTNSHGCSYISTIYDRIRGYDVRECQEACDRLSRKHKCGAIQADLATQSCKLFTDCDRHDVVKGNEDPENHYDVMQVFLKHDCHGKDAVRAAEV